MNITITIAALPPSDFKDLFLAMLRLHADTARCMQNVACLQEQIDHGDGEPLCELAGNIRERICLLRRRYKDLDRHYGWVLAGDCLGVAKGYAENGLAKDGGRWVRGLFGEHVGVQGRLEEMGNVVEGWRRCD